MAKGIMGGIVDGADALKKVTMAVGGILLFLVILIMVIGAFSYQAARGNIPITNASNQTIQGVDTDISTAKTTITSNITTILGFVALGVILSLVAALGIWKSVSGKGRGRTEF
jgi:hypothetical protein